MPNTYQPLTPEQFQKARSAGFSAQQIVANEQKRKASISAPPAQPQSLGQKIVGGIEKTAEVINQTVGKPFIDLAAAPTQLLAKSLGKPDPFADKALNGVDVAPTSAPLRKAGSAIEAASYFAPIGTAAKATEKALIPFVGKALGKFGGNLAASTGTGYAVDVGMNLAEGKTGTEALTPGLGTGLGATLPVVPPALSALRRGAGEAVGVSTGAGYGAIKEAFNAASAGGERARAFTEALRGRTPPEAIVAEADNSLKTIIRNRSNAYHEQLAKVTANNKKSFDISPVQEKLNTMLADFNVTRDATTGALDFSRSPGLGRYKTDLQDIQDVLDNWGTKPGDRTVVGIDKLKQTLDDFRRGSADSRKFDSFVTGLRNTAKDIIKDEPGYAKLVSDYADQTELIKDIQKGLSLGDKASVDTGFRKLTTALRTNNEFRKELIDELDKASGGFLSSRIAGQQLSEALPRGIARQIEGFGALAAVTSGVGIIPLLKLAAFASPRVVGEIVNALGISKRVFLELLDRLGAQSAQFPGDRALPEVRQYLEAHPPSLGLAMKDVNKMSAAERAALPNQSPKALGGVPSTPFEGFSDLTTNILDDLKGRSTVSRQYILDSLNRQGVTQAEKGAFTAALDSVPGKTLNAKQFADAVKTQLLPLERTDFTTAIGSGPRYESVNLPDEARGDVVNYSENIYQSPIDTSAGNVHFNYGERKAKGYFAHTRTEDLQGLVEGESSAGKYTYPDETVDGDTRRVIELQSDLFQKGRLDNEIQAEKDLGIKGSSELNALAKKADEARKKYGTEDNPVQKQFQAQLDKELADNKLQTSRLEPYRNTWHERVIREEVKQAAKDGKTKLQFPTGETAMRVEGLAGEAGHVPEGARVGDTFEYGGEEYVVLRNNPYNDGYDVTPAAHIEREFDFKDARSEEIDRLIEDFRHEAFDGDLSRLPGLSDQFTNGYEKVVKTARYTGDRASIAEYLDKHADEIGRAAEEEVKGLYGSPQEFVEYANYTYGGPRYYATNDGRILVLPEDVEYNMEVMYSGNGELNVDKDNPIYKFYEGDMRKFLQKKYGAKLVTDPQGVTWYEVDVPKEAATQPVKAFGKAQIGTVIGGAAAGTAAMLPTLSNDVRVTDNQPPNLPQPQVNVRGVSVTPSDLKTLRDVLFAEISNRSQEKQQLEARVIANTVLNRVKQYAERGKRLSVTDVLKEPNQYQGYDSKEYQRIGGGGTRQTDNQKLSAIDTILAQIQSGDFADNTNGAVFYVHKPDGSIEYDDTRRLFL